MSYFHKNLYLFRAISFFVMLASIFWGYWWMVWIFAIIFLIIFKLYYEIIIWGVMYDSLYGAIVPLFWNINFTFTIIGFILFFGSFFLRKYILTYEKNIF
ncbi:MAG: hypothetical protein AAB917_02660 [Patescibacteria group bacterium]